MCQRVFPVTAWSRLGHRCTNCQTVVERGQILLLVANGNQYCSHLCSAIHTVNGAPVPFRRTPVHA